MTDHDVDAIWESQQEMYRGFEAGTRARTDQYIHESATLWDSGYWDMVVGLDGLNVVRAARPNGPDQPTVASLTPLNPRIEVHGDIAIARHNAVVVYNEDVPDKHIRNTGIWRRFPEGWRLVHNHEETL